MACLLWGLALGAIVAIDAANVSLAWCEDVPPNDEATCAQRLKWGGCDQNYMYGYCCQTCFGCDEAHGCSPAPSTTLPPPTPCPPPSQSDVRRLSICGSSITEPENPDQPILLRGFSWMFEDKDGMREVSDEDRAVQSVLPGTNLARLVMVHWMDDVTYPSDKDCYAGDSPATGYLTSKCLSQFDDIVHWAAGEANMWTIITARAALAAGDGGDGATVFTNDTLRSQMIAMWGSLARRYKNTDNIAGYEVMSEPRTTAAASTVHSFHVDACAAVWSEDPDAACFIGAAKFYNRGMLTPGYLLPGKVIYAANFFEPKHWVGADDASLVYGSDAKCGDVTNSMYCPDGTDAIISLNKAWLQNQLSGLVEFSRTHEVPIWIDQWGVQGDSGGGAPAQHQYLTDVLDIFDSNEFHWSYWIWRRTNGWECPGGFAAYCQFNNGSYLLNDLVVGHLSDYIGGSSNLLV